MNKRFFIFLLFLVVQRSEQQNSVNFRIDYDPWKSMYEEGEKLFQFLELEGLTEPEQDVLPDKTCIVFKIVVDSLNFTDEMRDESAPEVAEVKRNLAEFINSFNISKIKEVKFRQIREFRGSGFPLFFGYFELVDSLYLIMEDKLNKRLDEVSEFGSFSIHRGRFKAMTNVERNSVLALVIQLINEPWPYSMNAPTSAYRRNITDVMIHLIMPRYKAVFGEHYYRTVIADFGKTQDSVVVIAYILLDPDEKNLYHGTKIWYSDAGYVKFGKWTLFPSNFFTNRAKFVPLKYYQYLNDRSALKPLSPEFQQTSPILLITVPSAIAVGSALVIIMVLFTICFSFADHPEKPFIIVKKPQENAYDKF